MHTAYALNISGILEVQKNVCYDPFQTNYDQTNFLWTTHCNDDIYCISKKIFSSMFPKTRKT